MPYTTITPVLLFAVLAGYTDLTIANRDGLPKRRDGGGVRYTSAQVVSFPSVASMPL